MEKIEKLKFIYGEMCEARKNQQKAIEHINTKINWFVVLDGLLIGFLFPHTSTFFDLVILLLLFISLVVLISTLLVRDYMFGPRLIDMMDNIEWNEEKIIEKTNNKLVKHKNINDIIINGLRGRLDFSIFVLFWALILLFIKILIVCI